MNATVKDVAELAGVSVATVSKYMNGGNLREKYRVQVEKAVRELNYSVNEVARTLKLNHTQIIGILASDITSSFVAEVIKHIQNALMDRGYISLILDCQKNQDTEWKQLDVLIRWKAAGVILFPAFNEKDLCNRLTEMNIPVILVDQEIYGLDLDCVTGNNYESAFQLAEKIIEAGHTEIGLCRGTYGTYSADERAKGYEDAMRKHGLRVCMESGQYTMEGGYEATKRLLAYPDRPTAIMTSNYHMTIGMLRALTELGMKIPADISVAAFDKQEFDFALATNISCVEQNEKEIGRYAADLIIRKIENPNAAPADASKLHVIENVLDITDSIMKVK